MGFGRLGSLIARGSRRPADVADKDVRHVRLLPNRSARDDLERQLHDLLASGPMPLGALVDRVVERIVRGEIARGGWANDVGVWGPSLYHAYVCDLVRSLDGSLLVVDPPIRPGAAGTNHGVRPANGATGTSGEGGGSP